MNNDFLIWRQFCIYNGGGGRPSSVGTEENVGQVLEDILSQEDLEIKDGNDKVFLERLPRDNKVIEEYFVSNVQHVSPGIRAYSR